MKFGDNLRKLRKSKKLSQEALAEKMQVSRQSVSKWETGDAYPEMNNILNLCKIFHCHINDLVNDSIIDIDSLDEEIKMNVVKLKKQQQAKMKGLSKAIATIAKIGRIITLISIPVIAITMIILGIIIPKIDVEESKIILNNGNDKVKVVQEDSKIIVKIDDTILAETSDKNDISKIKEIYENNSKPIILGYTETGLTILIITLIFVNILLKSLENLFNNINKGDTPFTLENVGYIKKMAFIMIIITILPNLIGIIFELLTKETLSISFEMFNLVEILFLFSIAYIFEYGYEIQLDSKGKMYDETK